MRVRVLQRMTGEIDGVDLAVFESGKIYELPASLGTYLVASEAAEVVAGDTPGPASPSSEVRFSSLAPKLRSVANDPGRRPTIQPMVAPTPSDP